MVCGAGGIARFATLAACGARRPHPPRRAVGSTLSHSRTTPSAPAESGIASGGDSMRSCCAWMAASSCGDVWPGKGTCPQRSS
eukprot:6878227-Prymnesium_polylepis.2